MPKPKFAANLSMLYPELPFLDRFEVAARDGFRGVEYLFPYAFDPAEIAERLRRFDLQQVLFNAPPGNWDAGERGLTCLAEREDEFRNSILEALRYASALQCRQIHIMAGLVANGAAREQLHAGYVKRLRWAATEATKQQVDVLIEPINLRDMPGYFLNRQDQAHAIVMEVGLSNLKVQMDLYHCQIVEGDLAMRIRRYIPEGRVGHVQIAGVPDRNEPDRGEVNYAYVFEQLEAAGYRGWIGCEYRPRRGMEGGGTSQGLVWMKQYL
ncbi:MAG TPA: 2-oxo-tetronate isomerase [Pyrinomonadaceae bacterium]